MKTILFFIVSAISLSSCMALYGVHNPKRINESNIEEENKKYKIDNAIILTDSYKSSLSRVNDDLIKNDLSQPLQIWVIEDDKVKFSKLNCNTGGFPNLKWNIEEEYKNNKVYTHNNDKTIIFFKENNYILKDKKPTVLIFYSYFMGRQNKRFLDECKNFLKLHPELTHKYINADNVF